jgi:hypothetical protein
MVTAFNEVLLQGNGDPHVEVVLQDINWNLLDLCVVLRIHHLLASCLIHNFVVTEQVEQVQSQNCVFLLTLGKQLSELLVVSFDHSIIPLELLDVLLLHTQESSVFVNFPRQDALLSVYLCCRRQVLEMRQADSKLLDQSISFSQCFS